MASPRVTESNQQHMFGLSLPKSIAREDIFESCQAPLIFANQVGYFRNNRRSLTSTLKQIMILAKGRLINLNAEVSL